MTGDTNGREKIKMKLYPIAYMNGILKKKKKAKKEKKQATISATVIAL